MLKSGLRCTEWEGGAPWPSPRDRHHSECPPGVAWVGLMLAWSQAGPAGAREWPLPRAEPAGIQGRRGSWSPGGGRVFHEAGS